MTPILSNYQEGTRNAKVYKDASGHYSVIVYDAVDDFNGYESFLTIDLAEDFAEDWVMRAGR
jgi:hypothetical protein